MKPFVCKFPGCKKEFMTSTQLEKHERMHGKRRHLNGVVENTICVCSVEGCHFTTVDFSAFKSHMDTSHPSSLKESHRIACTVPGCSHTFSSVGE